MFCLVMTYGADLMLIPQEQNLLIRTTYEYVEIYNRVRFEWTECQTKMCNSNAMSMDIVKIIKTHKKSWNNHMSRADKTSLIKICRGHEPTRTSRSSGRPYQLFG